jgi:hypothetical protein
MTRYRYPDGSSFAALITTIVILLAGCAAQLAPPYDKAVVDGLNEANTQTMTMLAATSAGTKHDDFNARADKYSTLIGKLDALAILAGARPVPKGNVSDTINKILDKRGTSPLAEDDATPPSAHAIKKISETIAKMRDTDRKQGVTATEVMAFKGQVTIYFDQAVTYENFLQR